VSAFMLTVLNDADAATARATLGALGLVVPTPVGSTDAANKAYVDTAVAGAASALSFSALSLSAAGTGASFSVTAGEVLLRSAGGVPKLASAVSLTVDTSTVGANGLDTGTLAASTWYAVWVISNGSTTAGLVSLSSTAPTMPSGYTFKARVGWIRTDGTANKWPLAFRQSGRRVQYAPTSGANLTAYPQIAQSNVSLSRTAVSTSGVVPANAGQVNLVVFAASASTPVGVGIYTNTTAPAIAGMTCPSGVTQFSNQSIMVESSTIYWDLAVSSGGANLFVSGWDDNL